MLGTEMARHQDVIAELASRGPGAAAATWTRGARRAVAVALVHCADLSAPSRPPALAGMWALAVCEEFFQQAEREEALELELAAPAPKRASSTIWKSQARRPVPAAAPCRLSPPRRVGRLEYLG